jgi:hypothetical protein
VICKARGGISDALNVMEMCCQYAHKYRRKIIVLTSYTNFHDYFEECFILPTYISTKRIDVQYPASVYPYCLKDDIYTYETLINIPYQLKALDGSDLRFDLRKNYDEQYLVYDFWGGGELSVYFMKRIKLREDLRFHISSTVKKLGLYSAVHIRNTDYQTDYKLFLNVVRESLTHNRIVICTDSYEVQQYGKYLFGDKAIIPTEIPDLGGKPLHEHRQDAEGKYKMLVDAITDLFILACSKKLYITKVQHEVYSGFSRLALNLHKRKYLVRKLLAPNEVV